MSDINIVIQESCQAALEFFGERSQCIAAAEELSELSVELCKIANEKSKPHQMAGHRNRLVDEMADVAFMMQQMALCFHITDEEIAEVIHKKAKNLTDRIERMKFIQKHGVEE